MKLPTPNLPSQSTREQRASAYCMPRCQCMPVFTLSCVPHQIAELYVAVLVERSCGLPSYEDGGEASVGLGHPGLQKDQQQQCEPPFSLGDICCVNVYRIEDICKSS